MTRDDIIRMAQEAGVTFVTDFGVASATPEWLARFAALVAAAERDACAKVCDQFDAENPFIGQGRKCAEIIRARGEE